MNVGTIVVVVGIMAYSIVRQIAGEPLRLKRLLGLPTVLTVIGVVDVVRSKGGPPTVTDFVLIGAGVVINVIIGLFQGRLMRLESRDGYLWGKMPVSVLWWWSTKIAAAVVLDGIGHALGAGLATTSAVLLLRLGVNRLGQAVIVAPRALATGIPFAPEADSGKGGQQDEFLSGIRQSLFGDTDRSTNQSGQSFSRSDSPGQDREAVGEPAGSARSRTPPADPRPSLKRQLAQLLLRELDSRINDSRK